MRRTTLIRYQVLRVVLVHAKFSETRVWLCLGANHQPLPSHKLGIFSRLQLNEFFDEAHVLISSFLHHSLPLQQPLLHCLLKISI